MEVLVLVTVALNMWACSGFPVYDYDPAVLRGALRASLERVNAQSQSPNLFRAYKSSIRRVNFVNENDLSMDIDFSIRETECRKESGSPPSACDFKRGYYVPTASCRSTVQISAEQVQSAWVRCHHAFSSSDSSSSEEIFAGRWGSPTWRRYYMGGVDSNEARRERLSPRSTGLRDVARLPARSRRRQDDRNRYGLSE